MTISVAHVDSTLHYMCPGSRVLSARPAICSLQRVIGFEALAFVVDHAGSSWAGPVDARLEVVRGRGRGIELANVEPPLTWVAIWPIPVIGLEVNSCVGMMTISVAHVDSTLHYMCPGSRVLSARPAICSLQRAIGFEALAFVVDHAGSFWAGPVDARLDVHGVC